jgi:tRNA uridine 5-carbamoylmethylation protein Kti12
MTSNQPDRLDRIEATLEQVTQALNNQVAVNADLRSSTNSLINIANQHQENFMVVVAEIRSLREDNQRILNRIERLENQS